MAQLIPHPHIAAHRERLASLRRELALLFDEYVRLTFDELPALRHRYGELFGGLEQEIQERTLDLHRRKRMVELFALKLDRGQKLDAKMVELVMRAVDNEQGELNARVRRALNVGERTASASTATSPAPRERAREARELYRTLARQLHPDARGGSDPATRHYWNIVQEAWLRHDLDLLRAVHHIVFDLGAGAETAYERLHVEERRLSDAIASERRRLGAVTDAEPYTIRESLRDEQWILARRSALESEISALDEEIGRCNRFLDPIFETVRKNEPREIVRELWADWVDRMYLSGRY